MEEVEAAAAAAAAGGWVIPAPIDENVILPHALESNKDNEAIRNVYCAMAILVNQIWRRRMREHEARDLSSFRKETNGVRREFAALRDSHNTFTQLVLESGDQPFPMPQYLQNALAEVELPPAGAGGAGEAAVAP